MTSSLASARCHHSSSCSKGDIQNECLQGFHGNAERFTPLWAGGRTERAEWYFQVSLAWCPAKGSEQSPPPACTHPPARAHHPAWILHASAASQSDFESNPEQVSHLCLQQPDSQKDPVQSAGRIQIWKTPPWLVTIN